MTFAGRIDKPRGLVLTHLWLVVLATAIAMGAAVAAAASRPISYTATAEVVVSPQKTDSSTLQPDMGTERAIALSGVVVRRGALVLGTDPGIVQKNLSVSVVPQTRVLRISYTAGTAEDAFQGGSVLASAYVDYRDGQGGPDVATLVTRPSVPASGSRGSLPLFLVLGLMAGLSVGVGAAWLWDRLSDRVRSTAELTETTGLPILARIPRWQRAGGPLAPDSRARESFAFVAARLASMAGHSGTTVVVTSPRGGAGTTSVACGTAAALAAQGKRVVLVAANPAGTRPEELLPITTSPALADLLARGCSPELALHPTDVRNLSLVPMGGPDEDGLDLEDLHLVLEKLERNAFVVIDAPPLLTAADALLLADVAHLVVLVGDLRRGHRADVREALALLDDASPRIAGWAVNRPPRRRRTTSAKPAQPLDEAAVESPVTPLSDQEETTPAPSRPVAVARTARRRPGMRPPEIPRTTSSPHDDVRPFPAPAAAAPRR